MTNRIKEVARERGMTLDELATRAGTTRVTISRLIAGPDRYTDEGEKVRGMHLTQHWMQRLAKAAGPGVQPGDFLPRDEQSIDVAKPDATPWTPADGGDEPLAAAAAAIAAGRNAAEPWVLRSRALEDVGLYPGDLLILDRSEAPKAGDLVCADVRGPDGEVDTVVRLFDPPFLVGAGPRSRRPIDADKQDVEIKGVVIYLIRAARDR